MNPPLDGSLDGLHASYAVSLVWVVCVVVLLYDTISKFPLEIDLIWRAPWTPVKVVYLYLRYMGLVQACIYAAASSMVQVSLERCHLLLIFPNHSPLNVSMLYLVYQMPSHLCFWPLDRLAYDFDFSRKWGIGSTSICPLWQNLQSPMFPIRYFSIVSDARAYPAAESIIHLVTAVRIGIPLVKATHLAPPDIPILGCLTAPDSLKGAVLAWSSSIAVAVIAFAMTVAQFLQSALEARQAGWRRARLPPLAKAFVEDGTIFFLATVVTFTASAIITSRVVGPLVFIYQPFVTVSLVVPGCRLVLNLREAAGCDAETRDSIMVLSEPADEA